MDDYQAVCPECHAAVGAKCTKTKRIGYGYGLMAEIHPERRTLIENKDKSHVRISPFLGPNDMNGPISDPLLDESFQQR